MDRIVDIDIISKCRVCFEGKDDMHSVFIRRKGSSVCDKLVLYTKLNIQKNDGGPSLICGQCLTELDITVNFLKKCKKSNDILESFLVTANEDTVGSTVYVVSEKEERLTLDSSPEVSTRLNGEEYDKTVKDGGARTAGGRSPGGGLQCDTCGKHFKKKNNLMVHKLRHEGVRRFTCGVCGERRYTRGELAAHARTHRPRAPPHQCTHCGKRYTARANLNIHMRTHTGERPHACAECGARFISRSTLRVHSRRHSGARPYLCSVCGARFSSHRLAAHMRSHAPRRPRAPPATPTAPAPAPAPAPALRCPRPRCTRVYRHSQSLNKHLRNHHQEKPSPVAEVSVVPGVPVVPAVPPTS